MKRPTRWLSREDTGGDSSLSAPGQEGPGVSAQSWFVQPRLPGEAWFQKGLISGHRPSFHPGPPGAPLAAADRGGLAGGRPHSVL